ncbi:hypothetical protein JGH11_02910 [Dysgonomonas sp. Marseille-P4677]|uniref:hypothetical protein n=1 Tax=Dysgonomonas sp. Marseille-P4677 TaxID=2364790 RepID=UPI001913787A|nr:hypothetical protein [Dysgonomonas sp. Marseille-P4677]MBK5719818.1 hypothetical protein [Dysgonomonas sp. Marseille-P4677]
MYNGEQDIEPTDVPESFQLVQQSLNDFVAINYETALGLVSQPQLTEAEILHYKSKVLDIIRNNPPLASLPKYLRDGREDYLWYSDFYDEISKDVYHRYRTFIKPIATITPSNYTTELSKIDLPYFRELVDLVSLERLCTKYEKLLPKPKLDIHQEEPQVKKTVVIKDAKPKSTKRSYLPKLGKEQYALLADCIEAIKLFRSKIKISELKKLLSGKLSEPLQVTNQKTLVYLFDQLMEVGYIKDTWVSVADGNKDFISFRTEGNKERYGDSAHYIGMQQLLNCRNRNKRESIVGLENIEDLIEELNKYTLE